MDNRTIKRRLEALQEFAVQHRPAAVVVTFTDGSSATTDPVGAIDLLQSGTVDSFRSDDPIYSGWAQLMTVILHPVPDRRLEDFE